MSGTSQSARRLRRHHVARFLLALALLAGLTPTAAAAAQQEPGRATRDSVTGVITLDAMTVTATRDRRAVFATPTPVTVLDSLALRHRPANTAADLFRDLAGLDITGVGTNQTRPTIRGQRGQRILLLVDGLRLNNSRRQQDFGELPALVDVGELDRVEIVRGPASVLYGTDAIGGVVNLITPGLPAVGGAAALHGRLGFQYGDQDEQRRPSGQLAGHVGGLGFRLGGAYRDTRSYGAPAGSFGDVTLDRATRVHDTGVEDQSYNVLVGTALGANQSIWTKGEFYRARDAGFGYVNSADYGRPNDPFVQILYPYQKVDRYTAGYRAGSMGWAVADRLEITGYHQGNERQFNLNVFAPFGGGAPPGSGVEVHSRNFTDLNTVGFRVEAAKVIDGGHLLTYGIDGFRDVSVNTDSSSTTVVGFGPPQTTTNTRPSVPNASFRSVGAFVQGDLALTSRLALILGGRIQGIRAVTNATPGRSEPPSTSTDRSLVGTANVLYRLTDGLNLVASVGRGFRSPNLVERFFDGATPEGSGYQSPNPNLRPETSLNVDLGIKLRSGRAYLEAFVFRNEIFDGIRIEATGDSVGPFPEFRNVNLDKLRYTGVEMQGDVALVAGLALAGHFTHLSSQDVRNPNNPVGDTYATKMGGELRYRDAAGRFWLAYGVRHHGEQRDVNLGGSPVGPVIPAFTVQTARAGLKLLETGGARHDVVLAVENLTNALYAESANVSFFRPEPGRQVRVSYTVDF